MKAPFYTYGDYDIYSIYGGGYLITEGGAVLDDSFLSIGDALEWLSYYLDEELPEESHE